MGELQQVLLDEELARRLQEEEERLLRRVRGNTPTLLPSHFTLHNQAFSLEDGRYNVK